MPNNSISDPFSGAINEIAAAIRDAFSTVHETDLFSPPPNIVDGLYRLSREFNRNTEASEKNTRALKTIAQSILFLAASQADDIELRQIIVDSLRRFQNEEY